jgi:hydrogenase-1 operon protein HyaE
MSGVIDALISHPSVDVLRKAEVDDFLARNPLALLFFIGDRGEGLDVAVVVRELASSYAGRLRVGVIDQRDEMALMTRFGVVVMPAVVYMHDGQPTELVARMRDWQVFAQAADRLLDPAAAPVTGGNA